MSESASSIVRCGRVRFSPNGVRVQDRFAQGEQTDLQRLEGNRRRRNFAKYKDEDQPRRVPDADWQAGVSRNSDRFHVLLNGEPVNLAIAASVIRGWVIRLIDPPSKETQRLTGFVQVVRGD
ncbi:MAG TPA: hypothetical protein VK797_23390 [Tepidisphaeraceae bacterium]|nr:hypothetical protein [Tepidisphaeraceae bacterium]